MPDMDGITLLKFIKDQNAPIKVHLMTAFASLDTAIEALKMGAQDYIKKPFKIEDVLQSIEKTELILSHADSDDYTSTPYKTTLICKSPLMKALLSKIQKVSDANSTVYIHGETGVGKELVARALHENSSRHQMPFIKVNCSALPETLLESELFGYEKGAFTGAHTQKLGRFELANGGTIFLDEIGDISPLIQLKLLRIIQEKELERLGGTQTIPLDVRIITATNKALETLVEAGTFRQDLYYRLNVIPLSVPPLRERSEDLPVLIDNFLSLNGTDSSPSKHLAEDSMEAMLHYSWPGNVRELENIIERLIVFSDSDTITLDDLPDKIRCSHKACVNKLSSTIDDAEATLIRAALSETDGNITHAAEKLGISRRSLHRKINKFNIKKV
jgi:DNA-binding NtrC family response regulator